MRIILDVDLAHVLVKLMTGAAACAPNLRCDASAMGTNFPAFCLA